MTSAADLPDDIDALKALLIAAEAQISAQNATLTERDGIIERKEDRIIRLEKLLVDFKRALYGAKSEKGHPDQYHLALEDIETAMAVVHAEDEAIDPPKTTAPKSRVGRGVLPKHLPRIEEIIAPDVICGCGAERHIIGEDVSESVKPRLIEGGMPTEATIASVIVSKYADHLPLYRQSQIYARQGVDIDRSTLAFWVGKAAHELKPVHDALLAHLKTSSKLFMDETPAPVLDPGRGKTKKGYFWALARDDRAWNGPEPPGVVFTYAPGRSGKYASEILQGFSGILQVDGYAGYNRVLDLRDNQPIQLAYCWAHARRKLYELTHNNVAPIAEEGLKQIAALYRIEAQARGTSANERLALRQTKSAPKITAFKTWLDQARSQVSAKSPTGEALKYIAKYWDGLILFLTDGRTEMDSNAVERTIRPIALQRKNALFAGHDAGAQNWAMLASLIETCKLNGVEPHSYLTGVLSAIVNGHKQKDIDQLLPWNFKV